MSAKQKVTAAEAAKLNAAMPDNQNMLVGDRIQDCEIEGVLFLDCTGAGPWNITIPWNCDVVDADVQCLAAHSSGTLQLRKSTNAISDAIVCAVQWAKTRAASISGTYGNGVKAGDVLNVISTNSGEGRVGIYVKRA